MIRWRTKRQSFGRYCHDDKHSTCPHYAQQSSTQRDDAMSRSTLRVERRTGRRKGRWPNERDHEFPIPAEERLKPAFERNDLPDAGESGRRSSGTTSGRTTGAEQERCDEGVELKTSNRGGVNAAASLEIGNAQGSPPSARKKREHVLVEGKEAYRAVAHAVNRQVARGEFREEWNNYFAGQARGLGGRATGRHEDGLFWNGRTRCS
jgi:hypothetical protein